MNGQKMTLVGVVLSLIVLLLVVFMVRSNLKKPERIVLPQEELQGEETSDDGQEGSLLGLVEIRSDTVQSAIVSLSRAGEYSRSVTVERYWDGGSGATLNEVYASGEWLRIDSMDTNADTRHTILTDDGEVYVWYGMQRTYFHGAAALSADVEQGILTYEDVLALPTECITFADYRKYEDVSCIYVETLADENGYSERYWVSTSDGLLTAAERVAGDTVVYRMTATQISSELPDDAFTLPDGTELYHPEADAAVQDEAENEKS